MNDESATPQPTGRNPMQPTDPGTGVERDAQNRALCGARTRSGDPCRSPAMTGQRRCRMHGGAAPQAKRKAALRLATLVDPAISTLASVMQSKSAKDADRLRAAEAILDRAGHPRASRVEGTVSVTDAREMLLERIMDMRARHPAEAAPAELEGVPHDEDVIVDAEVIEDAD